MQINGYLMATIQLLLTGGGFKVAMKIKPMCD